MSPFSFEFVRPDPQSRARTGRLTAPHGTIDTPAFIATASQAAVRSLLPSEVGALGGQVMACATYHLIMRPGADIIADLGGLHAFMDWVRPIMTDSGGAQILSLGFGPERGNGKVSGQLADEDTRRRRAPQAAPSPNLRAPKVTNDGVTFRSHLDGSTHRLTPESSILAQERFGGDIVQALDEPTSAAYDERRTSLAMHRTHLWAERSLAARRRTDQALYGVVGGGVFRRLRERSAEFVGGLPFDGYVIGGSIGTTARHLEHLLDWSIPVLPDARPRHVSGLGEPADLFRAVERGIDTIDGTIPVRHANRGVVMTTDGPLTISKRIYREDDGPIDPACDCLTCSTFTRAYLRHLFAADELLGYTLALTHNLAFVFRLMAQMRTAIAAGALAELKTAVLGRYGRRPPDSQRLAM